MNTIGGVSIYAYYTINYGPRIRNGVDAYSTMYYYTTRTQNYDSQHSSGIIKLTKGSTVDMYIYIYDSSYSIAPGSTFTITYISNL